MITAARGLAFFMIFSCVVLLSTFYAWLPSETTKVFRQEIDHGVTRMQSHTPGTARAEATCADGPKSNLYFLKTHKTGSSTLQNILVRYAWGKKLLVGLPRGSHMFRSYFKGAKFMKSQMQSLPPGRKPNMLVHHMIFNHKEVATVLPPDSVYFTILRDPATKFESLFYVKMHQVRGFKRANESGGLKEFLEHPMKYFKGVRDGMLWWFAKNGVLFEFGYDNLNDTDAYIDNAIKEIDEIFDLVLITEYFDMSLILLKDLLCWNMTDIVHLSINARNTSTVKHVTNDMKKKIYEWNKVETALYRHFNESFWKRVEEYGKKRMERDLKELESATNKLAKFCVEDDLSSNEEIKDRTFKKTGNKGTHYVQYRFKEQAKNNETCKGLILPEVQWWKKLSKFQDSFQKRTA